MTTTLPVPPSTPTRPTDLVAALAAHRGRTALVDVDGEMSYAELADRVEQVRRRLGPARRLAAVEAPATVAALVGYLGALASGCPVLLLPPDGGDSALARAYSPDVLVRPDGGRVAVDERRHASAHRLHAELALLLTTSGSSGSPKLVRLSHRNLRANAAAIASALDIGPDDRAITALPLHYCYGLSVVHSHLLQGAAVVLTERSVLDDGFWELFVRSGATTLPAVPYTFDLLERAGFRERSLPSLRSVTQAGGRLAPERVREYAALGAARGWRLHVMYGQTEATARMAVLPAHLAEHRPESIGAPVPGGSFALAPVDGQPDGVGELVYHGPNVMLGYATGPADLDLGRTVDALHTGDLARRGADGLYEVVGRRSRLVKLFGLRVDQAHAEQQLQGRGLHGAVEPVGDDRLGVAVEGPADAAAVQRHLVAVTGLPCHAVVVRVVDALPRSASGKVDGAAVRALLTQTAPAPPAPGVRALYEELLGAPVRGDDTFAGRGGDSLTYVEMSVRLEGLLDRVPDDWPTRTVDELARPQPAAAPRRRPTADTTVLLRAAAIVLVVASHANLFDLRGGAHLLLLLAGYNLARFQLAADGPDRARALLRSVRRVVLPAVTWIAAVTALGGPYAWPNVLLLNAVLGPDEWDRRWSFWFVEALVALLLLVAALLSVPALDRAQRRLPFAVPVALVGLGLLVRFSVVDLPTGPGERFTAPAVLWVFALGWAAAAAATRPRRLLVAALGAVGLLGWFDGDTSRELIVLGGLVAVLVAARVPCPPVIARAAGVVATASLFVYVTHWQVYPRWEDSVPLVALAASLAVGIAYERLWSGATQRLAAAARRREGRRLSRPAAARAAAAG